MDVVLALGGGGAKCFAQVGALRALADAGIRIRGVACTSAGGLVGAPLAAGVPLERILSALTAVHGRPPQRARQGAGLFDPRAALGVIDALVGDRAFDDLAMPLALTAVDLETGRPLVLRTGSVCRALHAAVAVPGLFPPAAHDGRAVVDGGVLDPVPVALARRLVPGLAAVAVVVAQPVGAWSAHRLPRRLAGVGFLRRLSAWRPVQAFEVFLRASDLTHRQLLEARLALDRPELLIRPEVPILDLFQPVDIAGLVAAGEAAAAGALRGAWGDAAEAGRADGAFASRFGG